MDAYLTEQMQSLDLETAAKAFTGMFPGYQVDINSLFELIITGQAGEAFRVLVQALKEGTAGDLAGMRTLLVSILVIGIFSALLSDFSDILSRGKPEEQDFIFCICCFYQFLRELLQ